MITEDALTQRINDLEIERARVVIQTDATYNGAIQELKRLRDSLLERSSSNNKENKEIKK